MIKYIHILALNMFVRWGISKVAHLKYFLMILTKAKFKSGAHCSEKKAINS